MKARGARQRTKRIEDDDDDEDEDERLRMGG
jgi:hypothetical protein